MFSKRDYELLFKILVYYFFFIKLAIFQMRFIRKYHCGDGGGGAALQCPTEKQDAESRK